MPVSGAVVLSRLSVIVSSSLAQGSHTFWGESDTDTNSAKHSANIANATNVTTASCHDPCADLQHSVTRGMVLAPLAVALVFFVCGALPVLVLRSRYKVQGVRSCLWVLVELWLHLVLTTVVFEFDRAQAYVWALHCSSYILSAWQPRRGVMPYPGLQRFASVLGAWAVGVFAWQLGPPVGLAAWYRSSDALCGWKVHLVGIVGVELLAWVLGPFGAVVVG
jgi:hypothetical protein